MHPFLSLPLPTGSGTPVATHQQPAQYLWNAIQCSPPPLHPQVLHPQAMQPAIRSGKMGVRVKNSYNRCAPLLLPPALHPWGRAFNEGCTSIACPDLCWRRRADTGTAWCLPHTPRTPRPALSHPRSAPGTVIKSDRDMSNVLITSIVLKSRVTLVDIISLRMMGQFGFLATVFEAFGKHKLSVDVVATSEVCSGWCDVRGGMEGLGAMPRAWPPCLGPQQAQATCRHGGGR